MHIGHDDHRQHDMHARCNDSDVANSEQRHGTPRITKREPPQQPASSDRVSTRVLCTDDGRVSGPGLCGTVGKCDHCGMVARVRSVEYDGKLAPCTGDINVSAGLGTIAPQRVDDS